MRKAYRPYADTGIIRNRAKVNCAIINARAFRQIQMEFGSSEAYSGASPAATPVPEHFMVPHILPIIE
ncbi:MAG: DNA-3-methyladenine glycosylase I [Candidatus Neomarinimicrobiota bacterium]